MINIKTSKIVFSVFAFTLISCKKIDRCGVIIDKVVIEDRYYLIFDSDDFNQFGGTGINQTIYYVPDNRSSGEVSEGIYNKFKIGEEYCQS
tara:strand:- start:1188 stop:1460 length:273 start_codon:yes stop_codon:yes gene_type:complete